MKIIALVLFFIVSSSYAAPRDAGWEFFDSDTINNDVLSHTESFELNPDCQVFYDKAKWDISSDKSTTTYVNTTTQNYVRESRWSPQDTQFTMEPRATKITIAHKPGNHRVIKSITRQGFHRRGEGTGKRFNIKYATVENIEGFRFMPDTYSYCSGADESKKLKLQCHTISKKFCREMLSRSSAKNMQEFGDTMSNCTLFINEMSNMFNNKKEGPVKEYLETAKRNMAAMKSSIKFKGAVELDAGEYGADYFTSNKKLKAGDLPYAVMTFATECRNKFPWLSNVRKDVMDHKAAKGSGDKAKDE